MLNQQEATISKFINKSPVYVCGQLPGKNVLEWQVIAAYRSVGLRSDGSYEMHQSCVSWGWVSPFMEYKTSFTGPQGQIIYRGTPSHYFCAIISGQGFLKRDVGLMSKTVLKDSVPSC